RQFRFPACLFSSAENSLQKAILHKSDMANSHDRSNDIHIHHGVDKSMIFNIFNRSTHNMPQFRLCNKLLPGSIPPTVDGERMRAAAWCGHKFVVERFLNQATLSERTRFHKDLRHVLRKLGENGDLDMIRSLRCYGIHCTSESA